MIPYGRQSISEADIAAVVEVLRGDWITQGPAVPRFEAAVATYCGSLYGVAVSHGTAALHLACWALGLGPGDVLWTSPNTFVASANCALYCGAEVDFVDIDPHTYNLSVDSLEQKLQQAQRWGKLPRVVLAVHFAGQPCDMQGIARLSDKYGFRVIEDASHAFGASYQGEKIGACRYSDLTTFSFHPVKIFTTGEGGMVTTNDKSLAQRLSLLRQHGLQRSAEPPERDGQGGWFYEQIDLGYNYRLTDIQAALGLSQLRRVDEFVRKRRALAARYDKLLASMPLVLPFQAPSTESSWHLYTIRIDGEETSLKRLDVYNAMRQQGIGVNVHYIPVHTQPYYRARGFKPGDFPQAEKYYESALTLPIHPGLSDAEQDKVVQALGHVLL